MKCHYRTVAGKKCLVPGCYDVAHSNDIKDCTCPKPNWSKLEKRSDTIELLERYSLWLEENGYLDTDWRTESPFAIDEFLKTIK